VAVVRLPLSSLATESVCCTPCCPQLTP
jgi:hypothetical protein